MRDKTIKWFVVSVVLFGLGGWMWHYAEGVSEGKRKAEGVKPGTTLKAPGVPAVGSNVTAKVGGKSYRLSNTDQGAAQLLHNEHAILLRNALIDTKRPVRLNIPEKLRAKGAPGSYLVQYGRPLDREFYNQIKTDGGEYISYIPNNAALVKADEEGARRLESDGMFEAVLPYEPYYKLDGTLLGAAVEGQPQTNLVGVTTFPGQRDAALKALKDLGAQLVGEDQGPFGPTLVVKVAPESVPAIAQLGLAREMEAYAPRRLLNDLSRVELGVSIDTLTNTPDYLNLTGSNVTVNLNDTGVDASHGDFSGNGGGVRLLGGALTDASGHGTHVAGIIAGNGQESGTVVGPVPGSIVPGADFRGKATNAMLYAQGLDLEFGPFVSDSQLEQNASSNLGPTNLISNNSWGYASRVYDMHSASYDAATRDAQPGVSGEQPLLFVFAAGDGGNGGDNGVEGQAGTVNSPGTAKNVITVGATDSPRFITNLVSYDGLTTNEVFLGGTDNSNLVAYFSGCGNVGAGVEGDFGRFKPDVVAPGVFIVSCRSSQYVDPTNEELTTETSVTNQTVGPHQTNTYPILIPGDASQLVIQVVTNSGSPLDYTNGFVVRADTNNPPQLVRLTNALGANVVIVSQQLTPGIWNISIAAPPGDAQPLAYDLNLFVTETNNLGDYFTVLSNMNAALAPNYVYQSGTSMSAGAVSGVLALMQEFLQGQMKIMPSPALMKALLINGSRSLGLQYDFNVQTLGANEQGWGMPNLSNCIPYSLTNQGSASVVFYDQSPNNNALSTGQSQTYTINGGLASNSPVRITLVWTDPPGDPAAGVALVNQLELSVTDSTGTNVFIGNDFFGGDIFSEVSTGDSPDAVNNVQNVYINNAFTPVVYPLTVTVSGVRVNVNAVTTQTNQIAQDYALVIASDNAAAPLSVVSNGIVTPPPAPLITYVTSGVPLLHERVGANEPGLYNYAAGATNGNLVQWHFFIFTNQALAYNGLPATNVAFATFLPPDLSIPRVTQADIDMYVSTDPALLTLNPTAVMNSFKSLNRGGTETFVSTTATNLVWYIGVKSEDQQAADFGFYAVAQTNAFSTQNPDGSVTATGTAVPVPIPDAGVGAPALVFAFLVDPANPALLVRDATVKLSIPHGNPDDLYGTLNHDGVKVVLNHYSGPPGGFTATYDDLQQSPGAGDIVSDGPGSLKNYIGMPGQGLWLLTEADNALAQGGQVATFTVTVSPQPPGLGFEITIPANSWYKGSVRVPNDATNLSISVTYASTGGGPVDIFLTNFDDVNFGDYGTNNIAPPGGALSLNTNPPAPYPPLSGGFWYYGIYNNNATQPVTLDVLIQIEESLVPNLVEVFSNNTTIPLTTDGVIDSQICITNGEQVVDLSVGVRIADTNLDDLALHLTSPQGTSVLLFENRGGPNASNLGVGNSAGSNLVYTVFTEDTNLTTTPIKFAPTFATTNTGATNIVIAANGFEGLTQGTYTTGQSLGGGWGVKNNAVGVVTDPGMAHGGTNFLALINGHITNQFNVIPGKSYQLVYWAKGPGITGWWPGDNFTIDIAGGHNGTLVNGTSFGAGEVDQAFSFEQSSGQYVSVPDFPSLHSASVTSEQWVNFRSYSAGVNTLVAKPYAPSAPDTLDSFTEWIWMNGQLGAEIASVGGQRSRITYNWAGITTGTWHHVAFTFDNSQSLETLYLDSVPVASGPATGPIAYDSHPFEIGADIELGVEDFFMDGLLDEVSIYDRALCPAEIRAIYNAGSAGKYNTTSLLPNYVVSIDGYSTNTVVLPAFAGGWQAFTTPFVASNSQVTVEFSGNTMSALFDDIQLVEVGATNNNNYFLPEEPLTPFIGQNPQGCWTLEIWDTRLDAPVATNGVLYSWNLQMTVSSTNVNLIVLTNHVAYTTGAVGGNSMEYFGVDVPLVASFATNTISNGSNPLNLIFNQTALPTGTLPGDVALLNGVTAGNRTLSTQGPPPALEPGKRYYLAVQNSGSTPAVFTIRVDFDAGAVANVTTPTFVGASLSTTGGGVTMEWVANIGQSYTVEASSDLANWTVVTQFVAQANIVSYTDPVPANTQTARFFRLTSP